MPKTPRQTPKTAKFSMPPKRQPNKSQRTREYLSIHEIAKLCKVARKTGRQGLRNEVLILMMFRHALRVSETVALRWEQVNFRQGLLYVHRNKQGIDSTHPLRGAELRALRQLKREQADSPYIFLSERQTPLTARSVRQIISRAGQEAKLVFSIHPHMLRHSTGFYLANKGIDTRAIQAYMGHANIKNTTIYTALSAKRFNDFWDD